MISCTWPALVSSATALVVAITALIKVLRHQNAPEPEVHQPSEPAP